MEEMKPLTEKRLRDIIEDVMFPKDRLAITLYTGEGGVDMLIRSLLKDVGVDNPTDEQRIELFKKLVADGSIVPYGNGCFELKA